MKAFEDKMVHIVLNNGEAKELCEVLDLVLSSEDLKFKEENRAFAERLRDWIESCDGKQ